MYYDRIMKSFQLATPVAHAPDFRVETTPRGFSLFDGHHEIGMFNTDGWLYLDLWKFSPHEPPTQANAEVNPYVRDMHTCRNSNINFPWKYARDMYAGLTDLDSRVRFHWLCAAGERLALRIDIPLEGGQRIRYEVRLHYDPAWGRYRCMIDADAWKERPEGFEPINFMMVGALHSQAELRRWSHSVWEDPWHKVRELVHSNALFNATDYGRHGDGTWRSKNAPTTGAWIAMVSNPDCNPAMVIHECNVPLRFATCSALFDEHLIWQQAGNENLEAGLFHLSLHTEFVNLGKSLADELLEVALPPHKPETWRYRKVCLPFHMNVVNSLEHQVDIWQPEDCPILLLSNDPADPVSWVEGVSHGGNHSIKLQGTSTNGWTRLETGCAVCNVDRDSRYRFAAWVRTEGVERFARLALSTFEYTMNNEIDVAHSTTVAGSTEWTYLSVELDSGVEAYMSPSFQLYGKGTVWFDDPQFMKIGDPN